MEKFIGPPGQGLSIADSLPTSSQQRHVVFQSTLIVLIGFLFITSSSYGQVLNITQAGVVESGYGKIPNLTGASSVFVKGNFAYVVGTGDVLQILDITLPGLPVHKGSLANGDGGASIVRPQSIVVAGDYAYITSSGANALEIVDVSDPSRPEHKGVIYDGGGSAPYLKSPYGIHVEGNYAYVASANSNALEIVDISNPALPVHKGSLNDGGGSAPFLSLPLCVRVVGNYA